MKQHPATPVDLPVIHPTDTRVGGGRVDVRWEPESDMIVLGWDLVLWIDRDRDEDNNYIDEHGGRWVIGICDSSANHLHHLYRGARYPSDAMVRAAIEVARASYPTFVADPDQEA